MQVIIMRGIPGSGKSTWVNKFYPEARVFSTDKKFLSNTGKYEFDVTKLAQYHNETFREYVNFVVANHHADGSLTVIVDNTNLRVWEIAPYYRVAEAFGCYVSINHMYCPVRVAAGRGVHEVPYDKVAQMYNAIEPLPAFWNVSYSDGEGR